MIVCGFEKFSMVDFDGKIACTVFTGGCNFRCPFCHNGALVVGDIKSQEISLDEVFDYLTKRKGLVDAVCVTGGEATLQKGLAEFYEKVRALGYATKLDTNGLRPDVLKDLLDRGLLDYVAMDIKNSKAKYPLTTGLDHVDMDKISESVETLKASNIDYEFRTTLIKEFHTDDDMKEIAEWIKGAKRYFMQHYNDTEGCISHGFTDFSKAETESFVPLFKDKVGMVGIRGYNF
ncbi:MAG: anaerobic ribonucleoside-triphosphate reductase activating protein [Clostridia bacterium]|nr:anaerobic ribonucleoside-triphosphate reductase activating protein [Clostridia bacterium]